MTSDSAGKNEWNWGRGRITRSFACYIFRSRSTTWTPGRGYCSYRHSPKYQYSYSQSTWRVTSVSKIQMNWVSQNCASVWMKNYTFSHQVFQYSILSRQISMESWNIATNFRHLFSFEFFIHTDRKIGDSIHIWDTDYRSRVAWKG